MKQLRNGKRLIWVAVVVLVLLAVFIAIGIHKQYYFFESRALLRSSKEIDLRDVELTLDQYELPKTEIPGCKIRWMIPVGDDRYDSETTVISVSDVEPQHISICRVDGHPIPIMTAKTAYSMRTVRNLNTVSIWYVWTLAIWLFLIIPFFVTCRS